MGLLDGAYSLPPAVVENVALTAENVHTGFARGIRVP